MKLPHAEAASVPETKITGYLLNEEHPEGRGKALFFQHFGFSAAAWEVLARACRVHAQTHDVILVQETRFGTRYVVEGVLETPIGRKPAVRVVWFIPTGETVPRLVTVYPVEQENDQGA